MVGGISSNSYLEGQDSLFFPNTGNTTLHDVILQQTSFFKSTTSDHITLLFIIRIFLFT
jgi:hypothetical protein